MIRARDAQAAATAMTRHLAIGSRTIRAAKSARMPREAADATKIASRRIAPAAPTKRTAPGLADASGIRLVRHIATPLRLHPAASLAHAQVARLSQHAIRQVAVSGIFLSVSPPDMGVVEMAAAARRRKAGDPLATPTERRCKTKQLWSAAMTSTWL